MAQRAFPAEATELVLLRQLLAALGILQSDHRVLPGIVALLASDNHPLGLRRSSGTSVAGSVGTAKPVSARLRIVEMRKWRRSRKLVFWNAPGPLARPNLPYTIFSPGVGRLWRPIDGRWIGQTDSYVA
jgi:hypothetical protein